MNIKDGQPKFKPLLIELETIEEIQLLNCISNFLREPSSYKKLLNWFSAYYQDNEDLEKVNNIFSRLLHDMEAETDKRLK